MEKNDITGVHRMNLNPLFIKQKQLDEHIVNEKGLHGQDNYLNKLVSLSVELGECKNEYPASFKFWSNKKNDRKKGLVEFVDCIHFAISIALELGYEEHRYIQTTRKDLNKLYLGLQNITATLSVDKDKRHIESLLNNLILLGYQLDFTEEDVLDAYENKNKESHRRQET